MTESEIYKGLSVLTKSRDKWEGLSVLTKSRDKWEERIDGLGFYLLYFIFFVSLHSIPSGMDIV